MIQVYQFFNKPVPNSSIIVPMAREMLPCHFVSKIVHENLGETLDLRGQHPLTPFYLPPPHVHPPPPPGTKVPPPPRGEPSPSDGPPPPPRGGVDTIANEEITATYYAEFMTDQLLVVRRLKALKYALTYRDRMVPCK